jgi:hypothetical protein
MMSIIPPKKAYKTRSIRIDKAILDRIHDIALEQNTSDNYIIEKLLEYGLQQYDTAPKAKK